MGISFFLIFHIWKRQIDRVLKIIFFIIIIILESRNIYPGVSKEIPLCAPICVRWLGITELSAAWALWAGSQRIHTECMCIFPLRLPSCSAGGGSRMSPVVLFVLVWKLSVSACDPSDLPDPPTLCQE